MSKYFYGLLATLLVVGCTSQPIPKNPPLVAYSQKWVAVNASDFVPPKAKTYIRLEEIDLTQAQSKVANTQDEQDEVE